MAEQNAEPIPGYRLIERLGGGGFGEVWRASAPGGMHKAIKFVYGDLSTAGDQDHRARQEFKALERVKQVRHPYILSLERYEVIDGRLLVVMELADRNLWDRYKECRAQGMPGIPREELLRYMDETAEALDLMNREFQLQHLDIKPQNLFLIHNHIKVADFGLVKDLEGSQASVTGGVTPVYAAPEMFDGVVSRFCDQYSLAIVYQELLTGQRPFSGTTARQLIMQHISAVPNVSALPEADRPLIMRALSKTPNERFPTCTDLARGLRVNSEGPRPVPVVLSPSSSAPPSVPLSSPLSSPVAPSWQGVVTPASGPPTNNIRGPVPDTGSAQGITQNLRAVEQAVLKDGSAHQPARPVADVSGAGSLFPAVVVALGGVGLTLMLRIRESLSNFVAPLTQLSHIRFLLIDTDPDVVRVATKGAGGTGLSAAEVVIAPLNRPTHYLKPRDSRPNLDTWLNPRMLYRIPRSMVTTGVRALGRLAFVDNYRMIVRRLQLELESALDPQALAKSAGLTGLGVRTNRPRAYILGSLAGGTGSGMAVDAAYTVRALLRQMGYENPDVCGLLALPPVDRARTRMMAVGNAHAALRELNHFGRPDTVFEGRYHDRESPVRDAAPPFNRLLVQPMPDESDEQACQEAIDLCAGLVYRELVTPLGRALDLGRAGVPAPPWDSRGQFASTMNYFEVSWPRHAVLQSLSRQLCRRLVTRWASKDSKPLREAAQNHVQQKWVQEELGTDSFIHRVHAFTIKALGRPVESLFAAVADALPKASAQGEAPRGLLIKRAPEPKGLPPDLLAPVLEQFQGLFGKQGDDGPYEVPPKLLPVLKEACDALAAEWSNKLAMLSVELIEEPAYRLAGAEEASRQFVVTIEQALRHQEPLIADLNEKARNSGEALYLMAYPRAGVRRPTLSTAETLDLLKIYYKSRWQYLILQHVAAAFVGLRGHLSDQLREVNFCRVRLTEILRLLEEPLPGETTTASGQGVKGRPIASGKRLFLAGCNNITEAVNLYLGGITADHLLELDAKMEAMFRRTPPFDALVNVCLTTANIVRDVISAMLGVAREYAAEHMPPTSIADLFFEQYRDAESAEAELTSCFDEAAPDMSTGRSHTGVPQTEVVVLSTPDDESGHRIRNMVIKTTGNNEISLATGEDIVFYRERSNVPLRDLEPMGAVGQEAYRVMNNSENFTAHSREDINFGQG